MAIVDKKFVFKVSIDEYNIKKLMPVFNVLRMSNDPDIIQSVITTATPVKVKVQNIFQVSQSYYCLNDTLVVYLFSA